jgi:superfamily II DNA or RNA helicase
MRVLVRQPHLGYLDNWFHVPKQYIDVEGVKNALSLRFIDAYAEDKVRYVYLYQETESHLLVPRFLWRPSGMVFRTIDCRPLEYERTGITSRIKLDHRRVNGELRPTGETVQQKAMDALLASDSGILQLGCGKGKTVLALDYIARRGGPALIVLDNTNLLEQWKGDIEEFLDVPGGVGRVQAGQFDWKKGVVLATYHTLGALAPTLSEEVRRWFQVIVFDEGHHISAATFAPCAEVFYGTRLALTATPVRDDGLNIIYDNHIGPSIYKDVVHKIKPRIVFKWTGIGVNATSPVYDRNGKVHLSMVSSYFGQHLRRMSLILEDVDKAVRSGRKVLVLCNSIDEVMNLCSLWTRRNWHDPQGSLYTDIPIPTAAEVGKNIHPAPLESRELTEKYLAETTEAIVKGRYLNASHLQALQMKKAEYEIQLEQDDVHRLVSSELNKRQRAYRQWLTANLTTAGLMIHKVDAEDRMEYIRTKQVVFGITKYGKEGLDDEYLDTVLLSTPFSNRNALQQVMGRPTRQKAGKKSPLLVIYEDDIGPLIGMCKKLRKHLMTWDIGEGGPFDFELHDHPNAVGHSHRPIFESI